MREVPGTDMGLLKDHFIARLVKILAANERGEYHIPGTVFLDLMELSHE